MGNLILKDLPKVKGEFFVDYNLSSFTRFKTGGDAEVFFAPLNLNDLTTFLKKVPKDLPIHTLGFGSNILVRDGILSGVVIRLQSDYFSSVQIIDNEEYKIKCGAFVSNIAISKFAMENSIKGFEFLFGIPGSIGGAILTNAGCFDGEIKDVLLEIEVVDKISGEIKIIDAKDCELAYRSSNIDSQYIITSVTLQGNKGNMQEIQDTMDNIKTNKDLAQPTYTKTAGSTFKNPLDTKPAWKLICEAGCQGLELGGAIVSPMHANFIINENNATSADIEDLAEKVRYKVYEKFGIMLEYEIKIVGTRRVENP